MEPKVIGIDERPRMYFAYNDYKADFEHDLRKWGAIHLGEAYTSGGLVLRQNLDVAAKFMESTGYRIYGDVFLTTFRTLKILDDLYGKSYFKRLIPVTLQDESKDAPDVRVYAHEYAPQFDATDRPIVSGIYGLDASKVKHKRKHGDLQLL